MKKQQGVIVGGLGAVVLSGLGVFAYNQAMQSPENLFLSRIAANYAQKEPASAFHITLQQEGGEPTPLTNLDISGQVYGNQEAYSLLMDPFEMMGIDFPEISLIKEDKELYVNAEVVPFFLKTQAEFQGLAVDLKESEAEFKGKHVALGQAIKELSGQEAYDEFQKAVEQESGDSQALNKELQEVLAKFLKDIDGSSYTKNGTDVTLTLKKDQVRELLKLVFETLQKSEHYEQESQELDKLLSDFEGNFDLLFGEFDRLEMAMTLGEKVGQANTVFVLEEKTDLDLKLEVVYNLEPIAYQKPSKPEAIIESDKLKSVMDVFQYDSLYYNYYTTYSTMDFTTEQVDELEKEYKKDGLDIEEKAELAALRAVLDEK